MLDQNGKLINCSRERQDVDLNKVTLKDGYVMYEGKKLTLKRIGQGSYGDVYAATSDDKTIELAIKKFGNREEANMEKAAFKLLGKKMCKVIEGISFDSIIAMQRMDGDLHSLIQKLHVTTVVEICKLLSKTLYCLLKHNIMYTDLKPANILYKCTGESMFDILLGDVGDVFFLEKGKQYDYYVSTFPYPFKKEGAALTLYEDLITPITSETAENHLVWGVACTFFIMMNSQNIEKLAHTRRYSTKDFLTVRNDMRTLDTTQDNVFAKALLDPTSVSLSNICTSQVRNLNNKLKF